MGGKVGEAILFYLFSGLLVFSGGVVVLARNPVHSVLFLIVAFLNAAGLFLLQNAELLAMLLVIVYVGAVAVLFLFVVMMLNVGVGQVQEKQGGYKLFAGLLGALLTTELAVAMGIWQAPASTGLQLTTGQSLTNAHQIGLVLYTDYLLFFQLAGAVLFVAMIGAIVLALRVRPGVRRQDIGRQIKRQAAETLELKKVPFHQGVDHV